MFDAAWWHKFYGIAFDESYVRAHPRHRAILEGKMRRALYERFGSVGLGDKSSEPVPVASTQMVPLCYLLGEVLGCRTFFTPGSTPCTVPRGLSPAQLEALEPSYVLNTPVMQKLAADLDWLEREYGTVVGDLNPQGVLNNAMCVADAEIFVLFLQNPEAARRLLRMVTQTMIQTIRFIRDRTGTSSVAVTNIVEQINPRLLVTSNCSTTMISPGIYREFLLEFDQALADALPPFGIHHCGLDLARLAPEYQKVRGLGFLEVGWGSDVAAVRRLFPDTHLNARYSPVKMRDATPEVIARDVKALIQAGRPLGLLSLSVVGLDDTVPDANVRAFFEAADRKLGLAACGCAGRRSRRGWLSQDFPATVVTGVSGLCDITICAGSRHFLVCSRASGSFQGEGKSGLTTWVKSMTAGRSDEAAWPAHRLALEQPSHCRSRCPAHAT